MGFEVSKPILWKAGLGFEDKIMPAVSYDSFEFKYADKAVTLHMRSGRTILEDFGFLELYVIIYNSVNVFVYLFIYLFFLQVE